MAIRKAGKLLRKCTLYVSILIAVTIGSYSIHYELSSPGIDLTEQVKIVLHDGLEIKGPQEFLDATVGALNLLREKDPQNYQMVRDYLGKMSYVPDTLLPPLGCKRFRKVTMLYIRPCYPHTEQDQKHDA